jgi:glycosyltransferase involved in cell wall biosynthesis
MSLPKVSVIIPAYNAQSTIGKTIESVFDQSYSNLEIIVINDGSTDQTPEILKKYGDKITLVSTENKGVSHARNLGIKYASGDYIQYLDSDDLLMPHKIKWQVSHLLANDADVAYGNWESFIEESGQIVIKETITKRLKGDIEVEIFTDFWCPPAVLLYAKKITDKLHWNIKLPVIQDARYLLDSALAKGKFVYVPEIMARYRTAQETSLSQKSEKAFVMDCFTNAKEVYEIWSSNLTSQKKRAIISVLRYIVNRLGILAPSFAKEAIELILKIEPNYAPPQKGVLRSLSLLIGYKNAEKIASLKRRFVK